ncbi:MAG: DUF4965 domain-containing protein [Pseudomonadota bacterium]
MRDAARGRAPAMPLIVHDPYFSVWSAAADLTSSWPVHWSGRTRPMSGMARVDGQVFRFIGQTTGLAEQETEAMQQVDCAVTPTRTTYRFEAGGIALELRFTTPALPHDLAVLARPITYVDVTVTSSDGQSHEVCLYLDVSATWTVAVPEEPVNWGRHRAGDLELLWLGSADQRVLGRSGDEVGIDWGYLHLAAAPGQGAIGAIGEGLTLRTRFADGAIIEARDDVGYGAPLTMPAPAASLNRPDLTGMADDRPPLVVAASIIDLGKVEGFPRSASWLVGYDQQFAVEYFHRRLRPLWCEEAGSMLALAELAFAERDTLAQACAEFDEQLMADAERSGGPAYARLIALAHRQCLGGHSLARDQDSRLLHFSKENSSNGCMATVDVMYPASPFFLYHAPELLEAQLEPVCAMAASGDWPFPFAPHDVGRFPLANGQLYGGGMHSTHRQMPVEESGDMLLAVAGLVAVTEDLAFAERYWDLFKTWADYLVDHGLDPENQLCTDDFAGHLARNTNLSIKAILAVGAFAELCKRCGLESDAERYRAQAESWVTQWQAMANDGDHYRLTFDSAETWSQKYNLVWDRILGLSLFPTGIATTELAYYRKQQNRYGLPLDNRHTYTKLDWILWSACLTGEQEDFDALVAPLADWLDDTPDRVPLSDWFMTDTARTARDRGFRGRTVVGGAFIKLLLDRIESNKPDSAD